MFAIRVILFAILLVRTDSASACGWWGDSEMTSRRDAAVAAPDGQFLEHTLNLKSMKLPGLMGYAIAVPEPGRAIPYLLATSGHPIASIKELKIFGFRSLIDLGTPIQTARLHRAETEAVGMQYFNIPIEGNMPNRKQTEHYNQIVINANNEPLLVYAAKTNLLGVTWASYRIYLGSPLEFALSEGRTMGLTKAQETELRARISHPTSK